MFKIQIYIYLKLKKTRFATITRDNFGLGRYFKRDNYKFTFISVYVTLGSVKTNILDLSGSARHICTNKFKDIISNLTFRQMPSFLQKSLQLSVQFPWLPSPLYPSLPKKNKKWC